MKDKVIKVKKPSGTIALKKEVNAFSELVESFSGEKLKPAEYKIVEVYPCGQFQKKNYTECGQLKAMQSW